jgi:hypothetical protein
MYSLPHLYLIAAALLCNIQVVTLLEEAGARPSSSWNGISGRRANEKGARKYGGHHSGQQPVLRNCRRFCFWVLDLMAGAD